MWCKVIILALVFGVVSSIVPSPNLAHAIRECNPFQLHKHQLFSSLCAVAGYWSFLYSLHLAIEGLASTFPRKDLKLAKPGITDGSRLGIYDGKSTTIEKHPYLVSIVKENVSVCGGVILSDSWVLTDGDCVGGLTKSEVTVVAGSEDGVNGTSYAVKKLVPHPSYDPYSYSYDLALIKIKGTFAWGDTIANVSLPSADPSVKTAFVVAGYGETDYSDGQKKAALLEGTLKWQSNITCSSYYADLLGWDDSQACAYNKGKATICTGDFGAPFVKDGVLYGVALGGLSYYFCTDEAWPVVIADVLTVVDWIQMYTGATVA